MARTKTSGVMDTTRATETEFSTGEGPRRRRSPTKTPTVPLELQSLLWRERLSQYREQSTTLEDGSANLFPEGCLKCGLYAGCRSPWMQATVPPGWKDGRRILIVGEAPGENEDKEDEQYVGKSGKFLKNLLAESGLKKTDVALTNSIRCRPPNNDTPTMSQIKNCRPFLMWEIGLLKPEMILGTGNVAAKALTGRGDATVTKLRGRLLSLDKEETNG